MKGKQDSTEMEPVVTLAVTLLRRSYGTMLDRKAEPAYTDSSHEGSDQEHR
jgi:hypothetical protein